MIEVFLNQTNSMKEEIIVESKSDMIHENNSTEPVAFDYDNSGLPRDFDIRIEVAEQREILEQD